MTIAMLRRMVSAAFAIVLVVGGFAHAATYAARVRWAPSSSPNVAGYRIAVRAGSGSSLPLVDAGLPPASSDGSLAAQVSGLDGRTDYDVTVTAYAADGAESAPSNAIAIGYAQVAARIDTDGDGLSDAAEDPNLNRLVDAGETSALSPDSDGDGVGDAADACQGTAAGAGVNAAGCACAQVTCDDGIACTIDTCSNGSCSFTAACPAGSVCNPATGACDVPQPPPTTTSTTSTSTSTSTTRFTTSTTTSSSTSTTTLPTTTTTTTTLASPPPITITTATLPSGTVGSFYSTTLVADGGVPPLVWMISSGELPPGLTLDAGTGVIAGTPTAAGVWRIVVVASDGAGSASRALDLAVDDPAALGYTIWPRDAVPVRAGVGADSAVELGVKFRADVAGVITGLRFYKHPLNTGPHVGNLWSSVGTPLASATFDVETASGWQEVAFSPPVPIEADTVYVASYHCANGYYGFDTNYFAAQGVDRPPLHAPASGPAGGNGVFAYGATSRFPNLTYAATNYWVDVVFSPGAPPPPTTTSTTSTSTSTSTTTSTTTSSTTSTTTRPTTTTWPPTTTTTTLQSPPPITITTATLPLGTVGSFYSTTLVADGGVPPLVWMISSGELPPGLTLDAGTGVIAGTPAAAGVWSIVVVASDGAGSASQALDLAVYDPAALGYTIWPSDAVPGQADSGSIRATELGVKFRADVAGVITGLRFYKHPLNTGPHVGNLWSSTGDLLATATFSDETESGWQEVTFPAPVPITADTVYVASYYAPNGHYSIDRYYFAVQGEDRPPLHALADGVAGGNGVFAHGSMSRFPKWTRASANYWVDVVFSTE
jgi:hypothetical protein